MENISIHASAKEATQETDPYAGKTAFQSTPPRRRRRIDGTLSIIINDFNPRLREGGDIYHTCLCFIITDFNPRLREGGDINTYTMFCQQLFISIHASAKEATFLFFFNVNTFLYFNPRLREGGDFEYETKDKIEKFQSTPPRRRRHISLKYPIV